MENYSNFSHFISHINTLNEKDLLHRKSYVWKHVNDDHTDIGATELFLSPSLGNLQSF